MTESQILSILPAMSALNSWCRVPFEQQLGMYDAERSIYAYKLRIIAEAFRLGMTPLKPVLVPAKCKVCKGTGDYEWVDWNDEDHREYETCRKCVGSGNVILHFIATEIGGYRWHSPLPHWDHNIHRFTPEDWKKAETTDWTPQGPGKELPRALFIAYLNQVERAITGGKFLKQSYGLHLGTVQGCVFCGETHEGRSYDSKPTPLYAQEIYRPGFRWCQPACYGCSHKRRPLTWPANICRFGRWRESDERHSWRDHAPLPDAAYTPEVTEWLGRRGIVIGLLPPQEYCYTPDGLFAEVIAATPEKTFVRLCETWNRERIVAVPSTHVSARPRLLLEAATA